jgi:hypothetical protein
MPAMRRLLPSLALAVGAMLATAPVQAYPVTLALENATFDDGGTASGIITLNSYGFINQVDVATTAGTSSPGYTYPVPGGPAGLLASPGSTIDVYGSVSGSVDLHLVFVDVLQANGNTTDQLVLGASYECSSFACTGASQRFFVSGDVEIPEPLTMTIFGVGLIGLAAARRRG